MSEIVKNKRKKLGITLFVISMIILFIANSFDASSFGYLVGSVFMDSVIWALISYLIWRFSDKRFSFWYILGLILIIAAGLNLIVSIYGFYVQSQISNVDMQELLRQYE